MMLRVNPVSASPDGYAALIGVETYIRKCGIDHRLLALVKTRVSQINGCAYCLHMHTEEALKLGESKVRLFCSMPGASRTCIRRGNERRWPGRRR